jgi:subtilase family serine protease
MNYISSAIIVCALVAMAYVHGLVASASVVSDFDAYKAMPPIHVLSSSTSGPSGYSPYQIKSAYHLPQSGGSGTIAIVVAFAHPRIEADLAGFDSTFKVASCTVASDCLSVHRMASTTSEQSGWDMETALDVEWAHAIAPKAHILLVEAKDDRGASLLKAVDYARSVPGVVAVSMSWGDKEFPSETKYDGHFASSSATFFAASGDSGAGVSWPAASPYVISVGGTTLSLSLDGALVSEAGWSGSGGGVSKYENEPSFQRAYDIPQAKGHRAVPDVAYDANPKTGFPIYYIPASGRSGAQLFATSTAKGVWLTVGGTSAGAPQWAAIRALGKNLTIPRIYADKSTSQNASYFRDIKSGSNGDCGYYCDARLHYDYITGLGVPNTSVF